MGPEGIRAIASAQLKRRSRLTARRALAGLAARLEDGERVLHLASSHAGNGWQLIAVTDRRLVVLRRSGEPVEDVPYRSMRSLRAGRAGRYVEIHTDSLELRLGGISEQFEEVCRLVHARIWEAHVEQLGEHATVRPTTLIGRAGFA